MERGSKVGVLLGMALSSFKASGFPGFLAVGSGWAALCGFRAQLLGSPGWASCVVCSRRLSMTPSLYPTITFQLRGWKHPGKEDTLPRTPARSGQVNAPFPHRSSPICLIQGSGRLVARCLREIKRGRVLSACGIGEGIQPRSVWRLTCMGRKGQ